MKQTKSSRKTAPLRLTRQDLATVNDFQPSWVRCSKFPHDFKTFLREMNGTDLATLNVYGSSGEPPRRSVGVYSYPRDIKLIRETIEHISSSRAEITSDLAQQGFELLPAANLVPIYGHRYVVCSSNLDDSVVLSIVVHDVDAIVYANSLTEYLEKEFLQAASS